jgi:CheY-like chemotaxis protein
VTAEDGEEALSQACIEAPDIILMDLNMPKLNGWDATKRLKQMPETMHLRVIALSAHALSGDRAKAIAAGCDAYVSKPIDFEHLLSLIESGNKSPGEPLFRTPGGSRFNSTVWQSFRDNAVVRSRREPRPSPDHMRKAFGAAARICVVTTISLRL